MRIKGRPSAYMKSLQEDTNWNEAKIRTRNRDGHKCVICSTKTNLDIHHLTYYVNGINIRGKELNYLHCLITVCASCHTDIHNDDGHPLNPKNYMKVKR